MTDLCERDAGARPPTSLSSGGHSADPLAGDDDNVN